MARRCGRRSSGIDPISGNFAEYREEDLPMIRSIGYLCLGVLIATVAPLAAAAAGMNMSSPSVDSSGMKMPMSDTPAKFKPTRAAYTTDQRFLVKLVSLPSPIPYEKYFSLGLAVYEGRSPHKKLTDAQVEIAAGMRHGMAHGFAHGMESSPKLAESDGVVTVSGMYFHMMGPWVLKTTVREGGKPSVAYFQLPCCGQ
jgi:hypothetical protein